MPLDKSIKKTLVIGSGPIVIGQAAEFDYAGAQACRVLKEYGINVVLVNSNPATIMTDKALADEIYLEPLTAKTVKRIIEKEKPDSLLAGLGGQTGLTISMQLEKEGFLKKHNVRLIGTNCEAIDKAEDRQLFKDAMEEIGVPVIPSETTDNIPQSLEIAKKIGYPVIVRPAFTLGGSGGGVAYTEEELKMFAKTGLDASPVTQILVEKYIGGWKEIEFEAMRDASGNAITVCSMENFDPVGIHTGDSIVVSPALTLSDKEYQMLRSASINIISSLGIVGGCNCQFALNPKSFEYAVIEVNPRVSRSSALASKATGYPIAKITAKVALGFSLHEITNDITGKTSAANEPTIDYVALKFPKWPFDKFAGVSRKLSTQMKATGEVMSIGPTFEMAIMKAIRGAEISLDTLNAEKLNDLPIEERLAQQDDRRIFTVFEALKIGIAPEKISEITTIDPFFIYKLKNLADFEKKIEKDFTKEDYIQGKRYGYTDKALKRLSGKNFDFREDAVFKTVDTCAGEYEAQTPYFYSTYGGKCESASHKRSGKDVIIVFGSGPIRIGQGIEFDYSSVHCVWTLKNLGYDVVIINNNPETVSTDYDTADRLYFEPLTEEDVWNIIKVEKPVGAVVAFGGQTAIKLTKFLDENNIPILGTSAEGIDIAEDRERFDELLESLGIKRPKGMGVNSLEEALEAADSLGYPVLLRPSYVIGGQNMKIVRNSEETRMYMEKILEQNITNPVLVDKYMQGTEIEVDVISDGKDVLIPGIMEHIERAGIHSGDSIAVYPPYTLNDKTIKTVAECSEKLALSLGTKGLVNIQYLIYQNELFVIEVNPRASRTVPYISKVTGVPMVDLASRVMIGKPLKELGYGTGLKSIPPYFAVKVPVFSFEKLTDANSYLGPEMKSTGEVLGLGKSVNEALYKGLCAAGHNLVSPLNSGEKSGVLLSLEDTDPNEAVSLAKKLYDLGFELYSPDETADKICTLNIEVHRIKGIREDDGAFDLLESGKISYIIYIGTMMGSSIDDYIALHRKSLFLSIPCFTSLDTANAFADIIQSRFTQDNTELVDINNMRTERTSIPFSKMVASGDDYIFIENFDNQINSPESLCVTLCDRHSGIGAYGIVFLEKSEVADVKMRIFNRDGSEGKMAGNCIRSVAKYLYDNGIALDEHITVETASGIKHLTVYTRNGKVTYAIADMGKYTLDPKALPCSIKADKIVNYPQKIGANSYNITCVSVGNPHCVVFTDSLERLDIKAVGPEFENAPIFPERTNTEFVHVVNKVILKMRVYERGNGETYACGTGACAAVAAAIENGYCEKNTDITVKTRGGDLTVRCDDQGNMTLGGDTALVFSGVTEI